MQDPISDMLTRIRNAQSAKKKQVKVPHSKHKEQILSVLKSEGYIADFVTEDLGRNKKMIDVTLRYYQSMPVIEYLKRISRPGLRAYVPCTALPKILDGVGIAIVTTSQGVMTDREARKRKLGGEVICEVA